MKSKKLNHRYTNAALLGIALLFLWVVLPKLTSLTTISWDAFGYYYYLRLAFIDHSLIIQSLDAVRPIFDKYEPSSTLYQFTRMDDGRFIVRYPIGQALLYLPFFILGHLAAIFGDFPVDGFSKPYQFAMRFGGMVIHFLGFVFTAKILRNHFSDKVVAITLIILVFGTNTYAVIFGPALSAQGSLFFLIALFIWQIDRYFRTKNIKLLIPAGFIFGLICLSRPTDFLIIIAAILWPLTIPGLDLKEELQTFFRSSNRLLRFCIPVVFCALIQFSYWKYAGGSWFINSYGNPAEGLDFLSPHTIPFLFSFKSGWFVYTPLMALVLLFCGFRAFRGNKTMLAVLIYSILFIYIASSWTNWWYGGAFSQRAMVQAYVLLSIPLAGLINHCFFKRNKGYIIGSILIVSFFGLSIWQTYQFKNGALPKNRMTKESYFAGFWDARFNPDHKDLLAFNHYDTYIQPNYGLPEGYVLTKTIERTIPEGKQDLEGIEYAGTIKMQYQNLTDQDYCFFVFLLEFEGRPPDEACIVTTFDHDGSYGYQCRSAVENIIKTDTLSNRFISKAVYLSPHIRDTDDKLSAYLWNMGKQPGKLLNVKLEVYVNPKLLNEE